MAAPLWIMARLTHRKSYPVDNVGDVGMGGQARGRQRADSRRRALTEIDRFCAGAMPPHLGPRRLSGWE
jgi:hypothetical protein